MSKCEEEELMTIAVKHGSQIFQIKLSPVNTVQDLQVEIEACTGVLTRKQKLIYQGSILPNAATLLQAKLKNGSKLMLLASGGAVQSKGQAAAAQVVKEKMAAHKSRMETLRQQQPSLDAAKARRAAVATLQDRAAKWAQTGLISLRDAGLDKVPTEVWAAGSKPRAMDLGGNRLAAVPEEVGRLVGLQRLRLSHNILDANGVPWHALAGLSQLTLLALDHNRLETVSPALSALTALRELSLAQNMLTSLPAATFRALLHLQRLDLSRNRLASSKTGTDSGLAQLGSCTALVQLDMSHSALQAVPEPWSRLCNLRELLLDGNRIQVVPAAVMRGCTRLDSLSLHGCPLTIDDIRQMDGFADYDRRRRAKHDKQIEQGVLVPRKGFDEGADAA